MKTDLNTLQTTLHVQLDDRIMPAVGFSRDHHPGALSDKIDRWERWRDDRMPVVPPIGATAVDTGAGWVDAKHVAPTGQVAKRGG